MALTTNANATANAGEPPTTTTTTNTNTIKPNPTSQIKSALLPISHARDILPTPSASLRRCAAYCRARARFWEAFPRGLYARLPTPGTDWECGFHALVLSAQNQLASPSSLAGAEGGRLLRAPTLEELREVYASEAVRGENANVGMGNGSWFTADQLAAVFAAWGRRFLGGQGWRCQMGWVMGRDEEVGVEGWPVMMNTPEVDTGEVGEGIVRVWVWNDGGSLRGGVGHFEGIRRPSEEELAAVEGRD